MRTITLSRVPAEELDQLEEAASKISPEIFDAVRALVGSVRDGAEIAAFDPAETLTPNQAAQRLGMSRTHLYKLLDRGEIGFDAVGRDRRIPLHELTTFELHRQSERRNLAERFAHQEETRTAAIDELADLL